MDQKQGGQHKAHKRSAPEHDAGGPYTPHSSSHHTISKERRPLGGSGDPGDSVDIHFPVYVNSMTARPLFPHTTHTVPCLPTG